MSWRIAMIGRWIARITGTLMFLLFVAFDFGEGPPDLLRLTAAERVQALGIATLFFGLPLAWKWEGLGGLITVSGFAFLGAVDQANLHRWVLDMPALAGALHLASWTRLRMSRPANLAPCRLPRAAGLSLAAGAAVFLMLCANEIFGQPPLMTPALEPDRSLAGRWENVGPAPVEFLIHEDGSVTGTVGDGAIGGGRITYGQSWFGRLLHLNSRYRITGKSSGEPFSAPFQPVGEALDGAVFLRKQPIPVTLTRRQP
jgi:hypothetical protein